MSTVDSNTDINYWANCPFDILLVICRKLDVKSLVNCMFINEHWQDVIEYYCQHFNMWEKMVMQGMDSTDLALSEKSILNYKDIIFRRQQWNYVKNATVRLHQHITFDNIRSICVYKDNLVIMANRLKKYYKIENLKLVFDLEYSCTSYDETSSLQAEFKKVVFYGIRQKSLRLCNKLHNKGCACREDNEKLYLNLRLYKVYYDCCYVLDAQNVLWSNKALQCKWDTKLMARYYGSETICGLHVYEEDVYVMLKKGAILRVDVDCRKFENFVQLDFPKLYLEEPFIFNNFSVLYPVPSVRTFEIYTQKEKDVIVAASPGLTCAKEHSGVLLMGYENGKIEIYHTDKLVRKVMTPELCFYLQSYTESLSNNIITLDIYEASDSPCLFVQTDTHVYEFLIDICHKCLDVNRGTTVN